MACPHVATEAQVFGCQLRKVLILSPDQQQGLVAQPREVRAACPEQSLHFDGSQGRGGVDGLAVSREDAA
jgi:hypothetical protein